ncbi:MAG: DUF4364 family protein [Lachnospiraceae bacterium]|nr:DUF4364 family protein [Lachnospiraceae bacterium]
MSEPVTLYKLIILYMLDKADFPLTDAQISDFILNQGYTDYFTLHSVLGDLEDSQMIHSKTIQDCVYYSIRESGTEALKYFRHRISPSIRQEADRYMSENRVRMRDEVSVLADYCKTTSGDYSVRCLVKEKFSNPIDLTITVATESQAKAACRSWREHSQRIYQFIMEELL